MPKSEKNHIEEKINSLLEKKKRIDIRINEQQKKRLQAEEKAMKGEEYWQWKKGGR